jgi:hypothetical protein
VHLRQLRVRRRGDNNKKRESHTEPMVAPDRPARPASW